MKLVNEILPVELMWNENEFITLVIEDSNLFTQLAYDFINNKEQEKWILSENGKLLDASKYSDVIFNPLTISLNQRKMINKLYELCEVNIKTNEMLFKWNMLQNSFVSFIDELINCFDYDLQYSEKLDVKDILKVVDLKFNENNTIIEKILDYLVLANDILKIKLLVFLNIKTYLGLNELRYIIEQAKYHKFNILLIERFDAFEKIEDEKIVIVDKDKCVIIK